MFPSDDISNVDLYGPLIPRYTATVLQYVNGKICLRRTDMGVIDEIRDRVDIVKLVSPYVELTQSGSRFRARCPFHTERTPSFFVFPEEQRWRCFGACASGGDAFNFVMRAENLMFPEALRFLARLVGLDIPRVKKREDGVPISPINQETAKFYHNELLNSPEGSKARTYLEGRGVTRQSIDLFLLGYSPQTKGILKSHLMLKGFENDAIAGSGLFTKRADGNSRELFLGRLQFPIFDENGSVVGFGGRSLTDGIPKYLNTPKTPIFDKSNLLYGMHIAKSEIINHGTGIVVEGYMDVLTANQHGFKNVVACMGTALTQQQVGQLTGICKDVVLALDPDVAGQEATLRSLETSWKVFQPPPSVNVNSIIPNFQRVSRKVNLRIALLPPGLDPDDLIRTSPERWTNVIKESPDIVEFLFDVLPPRYDLSTSEGKLRLAERFANLLLSIENPSSQDKFLERLEKILQVDRPTLENVLGLARRALVRSRTVNHGARGSELGYLAPLLRVQRDPLEEYTLALLFRDSNSKNESRDLSQDFFQRVENRELFTVWRSCSTMEQVRANLDENLIEQLDTLETIILPPLDLVQRKEALAHCSLRLEERYLRNLKSQEALSLASSTEEEGSEPVSMDDVLDRNKRLRYLFQRQIRGQGDRVE